MNVNCHFQNSSVFTVGEIRLLTCKGNIPALSPPIKTTFQDESNKYALHVLETISIHEKEITLKVTGYKTGYYKSPVFWLTNDQHLISVENLSWQIPSVITSETKPHPPYGPWKMKIPFWYDIAWLFLLAVLAAFGIFRFKKHHRKMFIRQRIRDRLDEKKPVQYFIRQLSALFSLKKDSEAFLIQLEKSFRDFLENHFEIPIEESNQQVLKHQSVDKKAKQIISELEKSLGTGEPYSERDGEQLLNMVRNWIFQFDEKRNVRK